MGKAGAVAKALGEALVALAAFTQLVEWCQADDACVGVVSPYLARVSPCLRVIGEWGWLLRGAGLVALLLLVAWRLREVLGKTFVLLLYAVSPGGFDWLLRTMARVVEAAHAERSLDVGDWEVVLPLLDREAVEMVAVVVEQYDPLSQDQWIDVKEGTKVLPLWGDDVALARKVTVACEELVDSGLIRKWEWASSGLPRVQMHSGFGPAMYLRVRRLVRAEASTRALGRPPEDPWARA
jgi:hypothetical protein